MRVLLIEDDRKATRLLARGLQEEGLVVDTAHSAEVGGELAGSNSYDAIVLDWLLPGKDELSLCRELRQRGIASPILMLTARDALVDRVAGLNSGADDYLTKPFAFEELLARLRALLRRGVPMRLPVLRYADVELDPVAHRVTRQGDEIELTPKEYAILELLLRHAGQLVTRSRIGWAVWEDDPEGLANLVDVHVSHLRRKLERSGEPLIHTVRGRGFRNRASSIAFTVGPRQRPSRPAASGSGSPSPGPPSSGTADAWPLSPAPEEAPRSASAFRWPDEATLQDSLRRGRASSPGRRPDGREVYWRLE